MAFAKVADASFSASGTFTLYQIDWWVQTNPPPGWLAQTPPWRGGALFANCPAAFTQFEEKWDGVRRLVCTLSPGGVEDVCATVSGPPPLVTYLHTSLALDWSATDSGSVYKQRGYCIPSEDVTHPTHPNHGWMAYAWGGQDIEAATTFGAASESNIYDRVPSIGIDPVTGWPIGGSGTTDVGSIVLAISMDDAPSHAVSGLVAQWSGVSFQWGGDAGVSPEPFVTERNGMRWTWTGTDFSLEITDWTLARGDVETVTVYPPTKCTFDLSCFNWNTDMPTAEFTIPNEYGTAYEDVAAGTHERNWGLSDPNTDPPRDRVWSVSPTLAHDWLTEQNEDVTPSDASCTIEERGLVEPEDEHGDMAEWHIDCLGIRRKPVVSVQLPNDAGGVLPTAWVAQDAGVVVTQSGANTAVLVASSATNSAIKRTLATDWDYYCSAAGVAAYGIPECYQRSVHLAGSDVWCWEQYQFLRLTFTSDADATLELRIDYDVDTVFDDHMTGAERVSNLTYSTQSSYLSRTLSITAGTGARIVDLQAPGPHELRHVRSITLSGFDGGDDDWEFVLNELELLGWNPTTNTADGRFDTKVVFPRTEEELPISYTALTCTSDGVPANRPPDQIVTLCGERGHDFVEYIRGRDTGVIGDAMRALAYWGHGLVDQEGIEVDGEGTDPEPWDSGNALYDSAFVDGDDNDMLGGMIYTGDVQECADMLLATSASSYTHPPVTPRVGRVYLCAGWDPWCVVDKRIHGQIHGLRRLSNGVRAGSGLAEQLYEVDGTSMALVGSCVSDAWSRYYFATGGRENYPLVVVPDGMSPIPSGADYQTPNQTIYNELRTWVDLELLPCRCSTTSVLRAVGGDTAWRAFEGDGAVWVERSADDGRTWGMMLEVGAGFTPRLARDGTGRVLLSWQGYGGEQKLRVVNVTGSETMTLRSGRGCPSITIGRRGGVMYVVDLSVSEPYDLQFTHSVYQNGAWSASDGLAKTVDTDVDNVTPSLAEQADGSLVVVYQKAGNVESKVTRDFGQTWE